MNTPPRATYRLQFNHQFTFLRARLLVPYLAALGISHVYASPFLKDRAGSLHGYDIVDPNQLNPEIGSPEDFAALVDTLHAHGMGLILDWVPNHMGIAGNGNAWWRDVLEHGQASPYAAYFDIDWHPLRESLRGKVLLPVLGSQYGQTLENRELRLSFDPRRGEFDLGYYDWRFPLDPETYPLILAHEFERLSTLAGEEGHTLIEWHGLITELERLRSIRNAPEPRSRSAAACKQKLAMLYERSPAIQEFLRETVAVFNGQVGVPKSFDLLHGLLERQSFQLAFWRVASDEINFRRFFDINELACLRQELPEVFDATHRLVLGLFAGRSIDGLRIDHPDGLFDPLAYVGRLQAEAGRIAEGPAGENGGNLRPLYLAVEKILAGYEHPREDWPIAGTTGYDFANLVNRLFVYPRTERELTRLYNQFTGETLDFDEILYNSKRQVIRSDMSSELSTLVNLLHGIAQSNRRTRDFTVNGLRDALIEVVASFPVYRTYITADGFGEEDRRFVVWAVAQAKKRRSATVAAFFDFIQRILLAEDIETAGPEERAGILRFTLKFQQYTAPVMAKGMEDTAFYLYNRLVSLNDVGGDPRRFGVSVAAFHYANQQRLGRWPGSMLTTATHDSKRSGDIRVRIDVITEIAEEWRRAVLRWRRLNRNKKTLGGGEPLPSRNDEYLLYQTLLGAWPLDSRELEAFPGRIEEYLLKAVREAKSRTSWTQPNEDYERAVVEFVRSLLDPVKSRVFLNNFGSFQKRVSRYGCFNSLSQTLLLLTSPGVPDLYQGTELWRFNLVDPDNRRPVDFDSRWDILESLRWADRERTTPERLRDLLRSIEDGRAKLFLIWKTLQFRRAHPEVFARGDYLPLEAKGERAEHLCAFMRRFEKTAVIAVASRWFARLPRGPEDLPLGDTVWGDTQIPLPSNLPEATILDVLGGNPISLVQAENGPNLPAGCLLRNFPVSLLAITE